MTLYIPFTQDLYNGKGRYISTELYQKEYGPEIVMIRDGNYPHCVIMMSKHTGNQRMFTFVRTDVDWTDEDGWNDGIALKYYNEKMDVELVIVVDR